MKIVAHLRKCQGHARCNATAPVLYTLTEDGYIEFAEKFVPAGVEALALSGARACPERALSIVEKSDGLPPT